MARFVQVKPYKISYKKIGLRNDNQMKAISQFLDRMEFQYFCYKQLNFSSSFSSSILKSFIGRQTINV